MAITLPLSGIVPSQGYDQNLGNRIFQALANTPAWISQISPAPDHSDQTGVNLEVVLRNGRRLLVTVRHAATATRQLAKKAAVKTATTINQLVVRLRTLKQSKIRQVIYSRIFTFAQSAALIKKNLSAASFVAQQNETGSKATSVPRPRRKNRYINRPPRIVQVH